MNGATNQNTKHSDSASHSQTDLSDSGSNGSTFLAEVVLEELRTLRGVVADYAARSDQITAALQNQSQSIVHVAEALADVKAGLSRQNERFLSDVHDEQTIADEPVPADDPTGVYDVAQERTGETPVSTSDWDDIRNAFLNEYTAPEPESSDSRDVPEQPATPVDDSGEDEDVADDELDTLLNCLPDMVEPTSHDVEELQRATVERDRMISVLVRRLQKKNRGRQTLTKDQLAEIVDTLPEELAGRVEDSLKLIDQQVRLGELELSLERARVSRQLSRLEETRSRLESNARSLGLSIAEDGTIEGNASYRNCEGSKGRRWLGVLGFGN